MTHYYFTHKSSEDIAIIENMEEPKKEITTSSAFAGRSQINENVALKFIKPEISSAKKTMVIDI